MSLTIDSGLPVRNISNATAGVSSLPASLDDLLSFIPSDDQAKVSSNKSKDIKDLLELVFKGFLKKMILAIISVSLFTKILPKNMASNIFSKIIAGFFGYALAGTAFVKFETWLEEKINTLCGLNKQDGNKILADLAAKTASMSILTAVGMAKKWFLITESFSKRAYNKALSLITNITKPFEALGRKLKLNVPNFTGQDSRNILNTFDNLAIWFKDFGLKAKQKKIWFLPTLSKILSEFSHKGLGWPNWRKAILQNTKPQLAKDLLYKFVIFVPLGVLLEFIFSHLHKQAEKQIEEKEASEF